MNDSPPQPPKPIEEQPMDEPLEQTLQQIVYKDINSGKIIEIPQDIIIKLKEEIKKELNKDVKRVKDSCCSVF